MCSWWKDLGNKYTEAVHAVTPLAQAVGPAFGPYGMAAAAALTAQDKLLYSPPSSSAPSKPYVAPYATGYKGPGGIASSAQVSLTPQNVAQMIEYLSRLQKGSG